MSGLLTSLWAYRGFVLGSVRREFQSRYRNSLLGALWTVLNPLAMITIYTVIFSQVMRPRLPGSDSPFAYSIYLCAGVLTWGLFAEITSRAQSVFIDNASMLKKISFPRLCLPAVVVLSALGNFAIIFSLFVIFLIATGSFPGATIVAMVPLLVLQVAFAIGLGVTIGVLNVFFRDVGQFFSIALQFWFWLTPIVYPVTVLPEGIRDLISLNPMTRLVSAYHDVLAYAKWPDWASLWPVAALSALLCAVGLLLFRARSAEMVDEL